MTLKEFLKSKTFICIVVLLVIALVCGGLLAIMNDLLAVTEEEKMQRAIKKIYGGNVDYEEIAVAEEYKTNEFGSVDGVYAFKDGNYLIKTTGGKGFQGGTVTLWIVAEYKDGAFEGFKSVAVDSYEKQTLMSSFDDNFTGVYSSDRSDRGVKEGKNFGLQNSDNEIGNIVSGATRTSNAFNNAVNAALYYIRNVLEGGK
ncbi:MAG TPA: FMN-binding protein [Clostridia bacterium]|jgi:Na+-translocating ferredoxin:NAD+ oxidoreductase RnfG subunit|nr:FMN-binding protein [Clostridia bacterium]